MNFIFGFIFFIEVINYFKSKSRDLGIEKLSRVFGKYMRLGGEIDV